MNTPPTRTWLHIGDLATAVLLKLANVASDKTQQEQGNVRELHDALPELAPKQNRDDHDERQRDDRPRHKVGDDEVRITHDDLSSFAASQTATARMNAWCASSDWPRKAPASRSAAEGAPAVTAVVVDRRDWVVVVVMRPSSRREWRWTV